MLIKKLNDYEIQILILNNLKLSGRCFRYSTGSKTLHLFFSICASAGEYIFLYLRRRSRYLLHSSKLFFLHKRTKRGSNEAKLWRLTTYGCSGKGPGSRDIFIHSYTKSSTEWH